MCDRAAVWRVVRSRACAHRRRSSRALRVCMTGHEALAGVTCGMSHVVEHVFTRSSSLALPVGGTWKTIFGRRHSVSLAAFGRRHSVLARHLQMYRYACPRRCHDCDSKTVNDLTKNTFQSLWLHNITNIDDQAASQWLHPCTSPATEQPRPNHPVLKPYSTHPGASAEWDPRPRSPRPPALRRACPRTL